MGVWDCVTDWKDTDFMRGCKGNCGLVLIPAPLERNNLCLLENVLHKENFYLEQGRKSQNSLYLVIATNVWKECINSGFEYYYKILSLSYKRWHILWS